MIRSSPYIDFLISVLAKFHFDLSSREIWIALITFLVSIIHKKWTWTCKYSLYFSMWIFLTLLVPCIPWLVMVDSQTRLVILNIPLMLSLPMLLPLLLVPALVAHLVQLLSNQALVLLKEVCISVHVRLLHPTLIYQPFLIGRTGITAITIAFGFFISIFFSPIFASFPPWATGPALIIVGSMMATSVRNINWDYPGGTYRPYVSFYTLEHHLTLLAFFFYRRYSCFHYANGHAIHLFHRL